MIDKQAIADIDRENMGHHIGRALIDRKVLRSHEHGLSAMVRAHVLNRKAPIEFDGIFVRREKREVARAKALQIRLKRFFNGLVKVFVGLGNIALYGIPQLRRAGSQPLKMSLRRMGRGELAKEAFMKRLEALRRVLDDGLADELDVRRADLPQPVEMVFGGDISHVGLKNLAVLQAPDLVPGCPRLEVKPGDEMIELFRGHKRILVVRLAPGRQELHE